jgi:hypothetical protein
MELILNLRSAREWHSTLEEHSEQSAVAAAAEETARRLEKILTEARRNGLETLTKQRRKIVSPDGRRPGAARSANRRRDPVFAAPAVFRGVSEGDWRALTPIPR